MDLTQPVVPDHETVIRRTELQGRLHNRRRARPQVAVHGASVFHDDVGNGRDVGRVGVEVHDARAQRIAPVDHGVRYEQLAAALQAIEERLIQLVQIAFDSFIAEARADTWVRPYGCRGRPACRP